ncbi:MAG: hypothetical protein ACI8RZ_001506 [Myxococcota bacterium]|jgi:hypothetical protein
MRVGVGLLLFILAAWVRLRGLDAAEVLGDGIGPWWVALDGPPWLTPHAPPFGWMLYLPYAAILTVAGSVAQAVTGMLLLHALAAPLVAGLTWRLRPGVGALIAGLAVALSPGLLDVGLSGAQVHLAPVWIGLLALSVTSTPRPLLAGVALAGAVMCHPLSLCALPLVLLLPRTRSTLTGAGLCAVLLAPHLLLGLTRPLPEAGLTGATVGGALSTAMGLEGAMVVAGLAVGLSSPQTRRLSVATLAGFALLLGSGAALSYLQPYHLHLLTLPALAGLAALPLPGLLLAVLLRLPPQPAPVDGSLAILNTITEAVLVADRWPVMVDHAWLSALPVAEPAAVMLDLRLRGVAADDLRPGGAVALIVSAEPRDLDRLPAGLVLSQRGRLIVGEADALAGVLAPWCGSAMALGGAWDGLIVLHPDIRLEAVTDWWQCEDR